MTQNYEALGRYVAAKEKAAAAQRLRNTALAEVQRLGAETLNWQGNQTDFTHYAYARISKLNDAAADHHIALLEAVAEANAVAAAAGQYSIDMRGNPHA